MQKRYTSIIKNKEILIWIIEFPYIESNERDRVADIGDQVGEQRIAEQKPASRSDPVRLVLESLWEHLVEDFEAVKWAIYISSMHHLTYISMNKVIVWSGVDH